MLVDGSFTDYEVKNYFNNELEPLPCVGKDNLAVMQEVVSFLASICHSLSNEGKDKLIRLQEAVYEATVRHYESQQMVVVESED